MKRKEKKKKNRKKTEKMGQKHRTKENNGRRSRKHQAIEDSRHVLLLQGFNISH